MAAPPPARNSKSLDSHGLLAIRAFGNTAIGYCGYFLAVVARLREGHGVLRSRCACSGHVPQPSPCATPAPVSAFDSSLFLGSPALRFSSAGTCRSPVLSMATCADVFDLCG